MIDFAQEEMLLLLTRLAFGNILDGADEAQEPAATPGAFKIITPTALHPTDLAVAPPEPVLIRVGLRVGGIQRRLADHRKSFPVVRLHPFPHPSHPPPLLANIP